MRLTLKNAPPADQAGSIVKERAANYEMPDAFVTEWGKQEWKRRTSVSQSESTEEEAVVVDVELNALLNTIYQRDKSIEELTMKLQLAEGERISRTQFLQTVQTELYNEIFDLKHKLGQAQSAAEQADAKSDMRNMIQFIREEFANEKKQLENKHALEMHQLKESLAKKYSIMKEKNDYFAKQCLELTEKLNAAHAAGGTLGDIIHAVKDVKDPLDEDIQSSRVGSFSSFHIESNRSDRANCVSGQLAAITELEQRNSNLKEAVLTLRQSVTRLTAEKQIAVNEAEDAKKKANLCEVQTRLLEEELARARAKAFEGAQKGQRVAVLEAQLRDIINEYGGEQARVKSQAGHAVVALSDTVARLRAQLQGVDESCGDGSPFGSNMVHTGSSSSDSFASAGKPRSPVQGGNVSTVSRGIQQSPVKRKERDVLPNDFHSTVERDKEELKLFKASIKELETERENLKNINEELRMRNQKAAERLMQYYRRTSEPSKLLRSLQNRTEQLSSLIVEYETAAELSAERATAVEAVNESLQTKIRKQQATIAALEAELTKPRRSLYADPYKGESRHPSTFDMSSVPSRAALFLSSVVEQRGSHTQSHCDNVSEETPTNWHHSQETSHLDAAIHLLQLLVEKATVGACMTDDMEAYKKAKHHWSSLDRALNKSASLYDKVVGRAQLLFERMVYRRNLVYNTEWRPENLSTKILAQTTMVEGDAVTQAIDLQATKNEYRPFVGASSNLAELTEQAALCDDPDYGEVRVISIPRLDFDALRMPHFVAKPIYPPALPEHAPSPIPRVGGDFKTVIKISDSKSVRGNTHEHQRSHQSTSQADSSLNELSDSHSQSQTLSTNLSTIVASMEVSNAATSVGPTASHEESPLADADTPPLAKRHGPQEGGNVRARRETVDDTDMSLSSGEESPTQSRSASMLKIKKSRERLVADRKNKFEGLLVDTRQGKGHSIKPHRDGGKERDYSSWISALGINNESVSEMQFESLSKLFGKDVDYETALSAMEFLSNEAPEAAEAALQQHLGELIEHQQRVRQQLKEVRRAAQMMRTRKLREAKGLGGGLGKGEDREVTAFQKYILRRQSFLARGSASIHDPPAQRGRTGTSHGNSALKSALENTRRLEDCDVETDVATVDSSDLLEDVLAVDGECERLSPAELLERITTAEQGRYEQKSDKRSKGSKPPTPLIEEVRSADLGKDCSILPTPATEILPAGPDPMPEPRSNTGAVSTPSVPASEAAEMPIEPLIHSEKAPPARKRKTVRILSTPPTGPPLAASAVATPSTLATTKQQGSAAALLRKFKKGSVKLTVKTTVSEQSHTL